MNTLTRTALLAGAALHLSGCLSVFYEGNYRGDAKEQKGDHYYSFYRDQTMKIVDLKQCAVAANYFNDSFTSRRGLFGGGGLAKEIKAEYDARSPEDAKIIVDRCLEEEAPFLTKAQRYDDLGRMYTALAELPVPQERKDELVYKSKTLDLIKAQFQFDSAEAQWKERKYEMALTTYERANYTARGAAKIAKAEDLQRYERTLTKRKVERAQMLVKAATKHERDRTTLHLAALEYARAYQLTGDSGVKKRFTAIQRTLASANTYSYDVDVLVSPKAGGARATKAAKTIAKVVDSFPQASAIRNANGAEVTVTVELGKASFSQKKSTVSLTHDYVSGTRAVPNKKVAELKKEVERLRGRLDSKRREMGRLKCDDQARCEQPYRRAIAGYEKDIRRTQEKLSKTPTTIQVPDKKTHRYKANRTTYSSKAPAAVKVTSKAFSRNVSKTFTHSTSRDAYPGNASVKLKGSNPRPPSRGNLDDALVSQVGSTGADLLRKAIQAELDAQVDAQKKSALGKPAGPQRDGSMLTWLMFMPNATSRANAISKLSPDQAKRAKKLDALAQAIKSGALLKKSNATWKDWQDEGMGQM
jgi:hypothetical protein